MKFGLVASISRPGGNVTGVTQLTEEVAPKRVELAHELIPAARDVGFLINPRNSLALRRRHVLAFFQKLPPCLVGIEACASSHHWSRELQALGIRYD